MHRAVREELLLTKILKCFHLFSLYMLSEELLSRLNVRMELHRESGRLTSLKRCKHVSFLHIWKILPARVCTDRRKADWYHTFCVLTELNFVLMPVGPSIAGGIYD